MTRKSFRYLVRPVLVVLLLLLSFAASGIARVDEVDDFVRAQMQAQNVPGLCLAVLRGGELIVVLMNLDDAAARAVAAGVANILYQAPEP